MGIIVEIYDDFVSKKGKVDKTLPMVIQAVYFHNKSG